MQVSRLAKIRCCPNDTTNWRKTLGFIVLAIKSLLVCHVFHYEPYILLCKLWTILFAFVYLYFSLTERELPGCDRGMVAGSLQRNCFMLSTMHPTHIYTVYSHSNRIVGSYTNKYKPSIKRFSFQPCAVGLFFCVLLFVYLFDRLLHGTFCLLHQHSHASLLNVSADTARHWICSFSRARAHTRCHSCTSIRFLYMRFT